MVYPITLDAVEVYAGDAVVLAAFTLKEDTVPVDFSDWDLSCQWRKRTSAAESITLAIDTTDAATGRLVISATAEQTRAMGQSGVWDLEGAMSGTVRTFVRQNTTYVGDVTRNG